jgi:hypothetical protein
MEGADQRRPPSSNAIRFDGPHRDCYGAPSHTPLRHTPHGAWVPFSHGSQQSDVSEHPEAKSGTQVGFSQ